MIDLFNEIVKEYGNEKGIFIIIGFGIISYILKQIIQMWINTAIEEVKNNNTEKIEKLKSELETYKQRLEHTHQISQITYQNLFQEKIKIYQKLMEIVSKYENNFFVQEEDDDTVNDYLNFYIGILNKVKDMVSNNKLFISNNLLQSYENLNSELEKYDSEFIALTYRSISMYRSEQEQAYYEEDETNRIYYEMYEATKEELTNFKKILNNDISKIREKINFD